MGERSGYEPGLEPIAGFAEETQKTKEILPFDIEVLALSDANILAARETLKNDPEQGIVHLGGISEFDNAEIIELTGGEYVFYIRNSNEVKFIAVCNEAGRMTILKMAKPLEGLEGKQELPN